MTPVKPHSIWSMIQQFPAEISQCLGSMNPFYRWAFIKCLCNPCCLIRRYHDIALLGIRSHDTILFSTWLKPAGSALWSYISATTNLVEMRWLSWKLQQGAEQSQQVPAALFTQANRVRAAREAASLGSILCVPSRGLSQGLGSPVGKETDCQGGHRPNRVTDPLPQTPEQQRACPAFLRAAASSLMHGELCLSSCKPGLFACSRPSARTAVVLIIRCSDITGKKVI